MMAARDVGDAAAMMSGLLHGFATVSSGEDRPIRGIALASRAVKPGGLFAAVKGLRHHGLQFARDAVDRGAVAVVWEEGSSEERDLARRLAADTGVPFVPVAGLGAKLGVIASRFFGEPSSAMRVVGVTGTDGKTSVSHFIAQALNGNPAPCGLIGTLGYGLVGRLSPASHTTPDAVRLQRLLSQMIDEGAHAVAMEVSSHALDQGRTAGIEFDTAVLTNLSRDHLDYHGSETAYADAKAKLFATPGLGWAILNWDDPFGRSLASRLPSGTRFMGYSIDESRVDAAVVCHALEYSNHGLRLGVRTPQGDADLRVSLLGRFNAANVVAALATLLALEIPLHDAVTRLSRLAPVPGRMEPLGGDGCPTVIVDYAHTPGALTSAIASARHHTAHRLWCVFGCGGDRDRGKRPLMGAAAVRGADVVVLTDDNPRNEDGGRIISEILSGVPDSGAIKVVRDRAEAIRYAVENAAADDVVLVAGKGHETEQIVGEHRLRFSDSETVLSVLAGRSPC